MVENEPSASARPLLVVVGIPTFRRPQGLSRLLDSLAKQRVDFDVRIVVADNDAELQEGTNVVERYQQQGFSFPLEVFTVAERGISQVRNALMQRAFFELEADMLAMLDDDEWAEEQWLASLVRVQMLTDADVVGGNVFAEFEVPPPDWVEGLPGYPRKSPPESGPTYLIYGTTNVLLSKSIVARFPGQMFDPFYSLVGRGDTEFFTRLKRFGATFAFAHLARSHEIFGASRLTRRWARERGFCDGAGHMRIVLRDKPGIKGMVVELVKVFLAGIIALCRMISGVNDSHRLMSGQVLFMRQLGKLSALLGRHKQVYQQIHGQ